MFNLIKVHGAVNWKEQNGTIQSDTILMYYVQQALNKIDKDYFVNLYKADGTEKTYDEVKTEADDIALILAQ